MKPLRINDNTADDINRVLALLQAQISQATRTVVPVPFKSTTGAPSTATSGAIAAGPSSIRLTQDVVGSGATIIPVDVKWPVAERKLSQSRTIPADMSLVVRGPFQTNGFVLTVELGGILMVI